MTRPRPAGRVAAALVAMALLSTGCGSGKPAAARGPVLPGTLYLMSGPTLFTADLWRLRDGRPERLTSFPGGRISVVTAGSGEVVVAEASSGTDKIARLAGDHLERIIDDRVFSPSLSTDGRLGFSRSLYDARSGTLPSRSSIVVRDLRSGAERVAFETPGSRPVANPAFAPDGSLAAVVGSGSPDAHVVLIGSDGKATEPGLAHPGGIGLIWSPGRRLVVTGDKGFPSLLWDPASNRRDPLPAGWDPLAWSPDGTSLLVSQGDALGRIDPADPSRVTPLGRFGPGPVYGAAWAAG